MRTVPASRLDCLVLLRVVATVAVVFGHAALFSQSAAFAQWPRFPYVQSMAVTVFFAVSGWTIAWVLDTRQSSYGRFAYDRFARLVIPLAPVLLVLVVLEFTYFRGAHRYPDNISWLDFAGNLAFLQDAKLHVPFVPAIDPGVGPYSLNRPLWTVSREFWIYLAFGGAFLAVRGRRPGPAIGALIACLVVADSLLGGYGAGLGLIWLAGAGMYRLQRGMRVLTWRFRLLLVPVQAVLLYALFDDRFWPPSGTYSMRWNLLLFANFACFMFLAPGVRVPAVGLRVVSFLGSFAFTTYLVHYPLLYLARELGAGTGPLVIALMTLLSFVIAWVVSLAFERRYRVYRDAVWNGGARLGGRLRRGGPGRHARQEGSRPAVEQPAEAKVG